MHRISLTSIPPRLDGLGPVLESLLAQGGDGVILCIPYAYTRFSDWDGRLPDVPAGVTVLRGRDYGAATKFTIAACEWPDDRLTICDDDCLYAPGWLGKLNGDGVRAASTFDGARIGAPGAVIVQGFGGVSFVPSRIGDALWEVPQPCHLVDDIWLSGAIAAAGLWPVTCNEARAKVIPVDRPEGLQNETPRRDLNAGAVDMVRSCLGVWG